MKAWFKSAWRLLKNILGFFLIFWFAFTIYCLFSVPELCDLKNRNPKTTAFQELRKKQWAQKKKKRKIVQRWVKLSKISRNLRNAVLVAEDPNFYTHHGLDFYQIKLAFQENWEEKSIVRGASTITQQLVKNLYLSPSQNPMRKWKEAILALRVERCVPKDRLFELYLNEIEWGESTYGVEAASQRYFGKPALALRPAEAALLAAMIPNPIARNPYKWNAKLYRKKNIILKLMWRSGKLKKSDYEAAVNEKISLQ
ncbi:MAG TPA: monofunctional biosynthetic peptidoglycan transglycosylase [Acidobacteriota bacterium]|nr:monofunctional biosynthetic peptidoglycan transglycosylase [Acidobacteriota bacterium]